MIIFFVILIVLLAGILFLRGEGGSYGKGNAGRTKGRSFDVSDKNFFL